MPENIAETMAATGASPVTVAQANSTLRLTARNAAWWLRYSASALEQTRENPGVVKNMREVADELDAAIDQSNDALDALAFGKGKQSC